MSESVAWIVIKLLHLHPYNMTVGKKLYTAQIMEQQRIFFKLMPWWSDWDAISVTSSSVIDEDPI